MSDRRMPPAVVFTDMDGTLLGHHDYSTAGALSGLARCRTEGIPVIPNTSKTKVETLELMKQLELPWACIVENGSAALIPPGSPWNTQGDLQEYRFGCARSELKPQIDAVARETDACFERFSDMSLERIAELTGLSPEDALGASAREYSEPLFWMDTESALERFEQAVIQRGLQCLRGGRFVHVLGRTDKGHAARTLIRQLGLDGIPMIALGDSGNDAAMIRAADVGIWVRTPKGSPPPEHALKTTIQTRLPAPDGWTEGVLVALDTLELPTKAETDTHE